MSDFSEVAKLAADLRRAPERIVAGMKAATVRSGASIERAARAAAVRGPHTPRFADSIKARTARQTATSIDVEVEPRGRAQSALGAILEFGTATSGPHPVHGNALRDETPVFEARLGELLEDIL